jgi:hypothetical protein
VRVQARVFFGLTTAATHTHTHTHTQQRKMFANLFIFPFVGGKNGSQTMRIFFSDVALGEEAMDRAKRKILLKKKFIKHQQDENAQDKSTFSAS